MGRRDSAQFPNARIAEDDHEKYTDVWTCQSIFSIFQGKFKLGTLGKMSGDGGYGVVMEKTGIGPGRFQCRRPASPIKRNSRRQEFAGKLVGLGNGGIEFIRD